MYRATFVNDMYVRLWKHGYNELFHTNVLTDYGGTECIITSDSKDWDLELFEVTSTFGTLESPESYSDWIMKSKTKTVDRCNGV